MKTKKDGARKSSLNFVDGTDNKSSNYEMVTRTEIPNSPFVVIGTKGENDNKRTYFGTMGPYRITEPKETEREIIEELDVIDWNRIIQVVMIIVDNLKQNKQ